jgi:hypothetical protein
MTGELAGLGRLIQQDRKNLEHPMPLVQVPSGVRRRMWNSAAVLDQGGTPQCVGYAGWGWLAGGPVVNHPKFSPADLYHWAQDEDEWPGDNYEGTSTLGLMKALKKRGYIEDYVWAHDAETLVAWILTQGPVLVGTSWYMGMSNPDRSDFLELSGENVGGHEWRIIGADRDKKCPNSKRGAVRMVNSWGRGWSDNGRAWLSFDDLDRLIKEDGEAVTATEIKVAVFSMTLQPTELA